MKEIKAIISAYDKIDKLTTQAALATVVRVEGSSYRRTGARMLVLDNGVWIGGISGGCLEGDALKRARTAIAKAESSLITYDTTEDDTYQIGVGLGCNGIIDVLFTPLHFEDKFNPVEVLKLCLSQPRQTHTLLTITGLAGKWGTIKPGNVFPLNAEQDLPELADDDVKKQLLKQIDIQRKIGRSAPYEIALAGLGKLSVFIEVLLPEIHLILMGHQYDVYPMARLTKEIGCRVTILSNPLKVNARFAETVDAIFATEKLNELPIDQYTAIVLMAHDYITDKNNLVKALNTTAGYIGMLGPKVRSEKIINELITEGEITNNIILDRIYAPAGLDIGATTPEEIALSIIAEIKTIFSKRDGGSLRLRQTAIHERD